MDAQTPASPAGSKEAGAISSLPQNFGFMPDPYEPNTTGSAGVPPVEGRSCSRHSPPRMKSTWAPGGSCAELTFEAVRQGREGLRPSFASSPDGLT